MFNRRTLKGSSRVLSRPKAVHTAGREKRGCNIILYSALLEQLSREPVPNDKNII